MEDQMVNNSFGNMNNNELTDDYSIYFDIHEWASSDSLRVGIVECVLINVTNVAFIFILVTSSPRKRPLRNGMLRVITVVNLVTGLCIIPFSIDVKMRDYRREDCVFTYIYDLFVYFLENFVQLWTLVLLLLHHFAQLLGWKVPPSWWNSGRLHQYLLRAAGCLYVLLPWLMTLTVVVPVLVSVHLQSFKFDEYCFFHVEPDHMLKFLVLTCFLPGALVVLLSVAAAAVELTRGKARRTPTASPSSQTSDDDHGSHDVAEEVDGSRQRLTPSGNDRLDPTYVHVLVGLVTVLLLVPYHAFSLTLMEDSVTEDFTSSLKLINTLHMVNDLAPPAQCLLWMLLLPDLRARLQQVWANLMGRVRQTFWKPESSTHALACAATVPTVTFSSLVSREE